MNAAIATRRLRNQYITRTGHRQPADVVAWLGAVQSQEYEAAKWALGLRMREGTLGTEIDAAFDRGSLLRTHVMRPTWHFVTPADIRWLLELTAQRVHRTMAPYNRKLELDPRTLVRGTRVIERSLGDRQYLTRAELAERLQRANLAMTGQRLAHLALYAELEGVICSGPRRGKKFTYALLAERAPGARRLDRDEALAELSRRYFRSHGPATIRDFAWWSGLNTAEATLGVELCNAHRQKVDGRSYWSVSPARSAIARGRPAHLLPIYDEYLVAYRDRDAVPHGPASIGSTSNAFVTFQHAVVVEGQVAGTWRAARSPTRVSINATLLRRLTRGERRALAEAADRYQRFLAVPVELSVT
jgi:hypothetical protein